MSTPCPKSKLRMCFAFICSVLLVLIAVGITLAAIYAPDSDLPTSFQVDVHPAMATALSPVSFNVSINVTVTNTNKFDILITGGGFDLTYEGADLSHVDIPEVTLISQEATTVMFPPMNIRLLNDNPEHLAAAGSIFRSCEPQIQRTWPLVLAGNVRVSAQFIFFSVAVPLQSQVNVPCPSLDAISSSKEAKEPAAVVPPEKSRVDPAPKGHQGDHVADQADDPKPKNKEAIDPKAAAAVPIQGMKPLQMPLPLQQEQEPQP